ncbi:hypothetical protein RchiOBHm_Chr3g0455551 [Rosa chinensis]|uniref:Uncharacterized protein n=1 Tax=Rosa chinensis TaxID=74649 RepID=A0A2P6R761_ROSCH|nr:hypothetical protein RchiOBHm_Chr3g0455551 [Rosa chinensis]
MEEASANLKQYYAVCFSLIAGIILFGVFLAPAANALYEDMLERISGLQKLNR